MHCMLPPPVLLATGLSERPGRHVAAPGDGAGAGGLGFTQGEAGQGQASAGEVREEVGEGGEAAEEKGAEGEEEGEEGEEEGEEGTAEEEDGTEEDEEGDEEGEEGDEEEDEGREGDEQEEGGQRQQLPLGRLPYADLVTMVCLDAMHTLAGVVKSVMQLLQGRKQSHNVDTYERDVNRRCFGKCHILSEWRKKGRCRASTAGVQDQLRGKTYGSTVTEAPTSHQTPSSKRWVGGSRDGKRRVTVGPV